MQYLTNTNILCITYDELVVAGLMSESMYKKYVRAGRIKKHGYGGNGRVILIELDSLDNIPAKYKQAVVAKYGDIEAEAQSKPFIDSIEPDAEAQRFFASEFTFEDGSHITDERQVRYCNEAAILNAIRKVYNETMSIRSRTNKKLPAKFWDKAVGAIQRASEKYDNALPQHPRRLRAKFERYVIEGYVSLIHGNWGNICANKICATAGEWLLARWAAPVNKVATIGQLLDEYNYKVRSEKPDAWEIIKHEATIAAYLCQPEIERLWIGMRYGELKFKEKYVRQHRTLLPTRRDSLWYGDGTKLNYYYQDEKGNICTCYVYEVVDVFSECLLGYHIGKTENYELQYSAYKMAIQFAGCRPYEIRYDNQGGHKKLVNGDLLQRLSRLSIRTAPYNGKSKTIESVFGRFQQHYLKKDWYFTGQNITAKKDESKANMEFILANKAQLPTLDEVKAQYAKRRDEWNAAKHYKSEQPHIEMYRTSSNDKAVKVDFVDIINMFGITTDKPSTYRANGIEITINKVDYAFEVLTGDNKPDLDFNRKSIGKKFFVRYCLEDMSMISLYEKTPTGMKFIDVAQDYLTIHRAIQEQEAGEHKFIEEMRIAAEKERKEVREEIADILENHNEHPAQYGLKMPNLKGIGKVQKATSEAMNGETETISPEKLKKQQARQVAKEEKNEATEFNTRREAYLRSKMAMVIDEE